MKTLHGTWTRTTLLLGLALVACGSSGCKLVGTGFTTWVGATHFWALPPLIPISPYFSQLIEDTYWEEERYGKVPILDPVEGENAPLFCMDSPSPDEIIRAMPDDTAGGMPFLAETSRNNVRMVVEPIVDSIGECRFYPMAGPCRLHKCHYKCTVYYEKVLRSDWPIPFSHSDQSIEVVYIDHDHLIRCSGPEGGAY